TDRHFGFFIRARQDHAALDLDERTGHDDEAPDHIEIDDLDHLQQFEELRGDLGDRQIDNIQLMPPYQGQQQVVRTCKNVQLHAITHFLTIVVTTAPS